jgi:ribosomal-protein-alanine N-acetyltransferase
MLVPTLSLKHSILRPWKPEDAPSLVKHANNVRVASNLRDGFPYPYTPSDARNWLNTAGENPRDVILAIEVNGEACGGIGLHGLTDVYRYNSEIGYWLSEAYWGRGIMTEAVGAVVEHAFTKTIWLRLFAAVFENNPASMHRKAVMKGGMLMDEHLYALLKDHWPARGPGGSSGV